MNNKSASSLEFGPKNKEENSVIVNSDSNIKLDSYYKQIVDFSPVGIVLLSLEGIIMYANNTFCDLVEYNVELLLGKSPEFFFESDYDKNGLKKFLKVMISEGKSTESYPFKLKSKTGTVFTVNINWDTLISATTEDNFLILYFANNQEDILSDNYTEEYQKNFNGLLNLLDSPVVLLNSKDRISYINRAFKELFNFDLDEIIGLKIYELLNDEFVDKLENLIRQLDDSNSATIELELKTKDGITKTVLAIINSLFDENGARFRTTFYLKDVSKQREIKKEIIKLENNYEENISDEKEILLELDCNYNINYGNNEFNEFINLNSVDYTGKSILEFIDKSSCELLLNKIENNKNFNPFYVEIVSNKKLGKRKLNFEVLTELDYKNEIAHFILKGSDITQKKNQLKNIKELSLELNKIRESKDRFVSTISHNIKNPIGNLLNTSDLLKEMFDKLSEDDLKKFVSNINSSATHLNHIVQDLLTWASYKIQDSKLSIKQVNLTNELKLVLNAFKEEINKKKININNNLAEELYYKADPNILNYTLNQIISNAIKFSYKEGTIEIDSNETDEGYTLEINDYGIGISNEEKKNLFKMDSLTSKYGTNGEKGTGLGLIISKELLNLNNIEITIENKNNTKVVLTFPKNY